MSAGVLAPEGCLEAWSFPGTAGWIGSDPLPNAMDSLCACACVSSGECVRSDLYSTNASVLVSVTASDTSVYSRSHLLVYVGLCFISSPSATRSCTVSPLCTNILYLKSHTLQLAS